MQEKVTHLYHKIFGALVDRSDVVFEVPLLQIGLGTLRAQKSSLIFVNATDVTLEVRLFGEALAALVALVLLDLHVDLEIKIVV